MCKLPQGSHLHETEIVVRFHFPLPGLTRPIIQLTHIRMVEDEVQTGADEAAPEEEVAEPAAASEEVATDAVDESDEDDEDEDEDDEEGDVA